MPRTRVPQALAAAALLAVSTASISHAAPPEQTQHEACPFLLTPPSAVEVSGSRMVVTTLRPGPCPHDGIPNESVVCVSITGTGSPGQCASSVGIEPALLYYPYQPGATYLVTGRGCTSYFEPPYTVCRSVGPTSFTV